MEDPKSSSAKLSKRKRHSENSDDESLHDYSTSKERKRKHKHKRKHAKRRKEVKKESAIEGQSEVQELHKNDSESTTEGQSEVQELHKDGTQSLEQPDYVDVDVAVKCIEGDENQDGESESDRDIESFTHQQFVSHIQGLLSSLVTEDPYLRDLHELVTLEEANSQIALEYGQAMTVRVIRADGQVLPVVVEQKATVLDLKKAIRRFMTLKFTREGCHAKMNWKYVWRTYWLYFDGQKLKEENKQLRDYGICNRSLVTFIKRMNKE